MASQVIDFILINAASLLDSQPRESIRVLQSLFAESPSHPEATVIMSKALRAIGEGSEAEAIRQLVMAIESHPKAVDLRIELAKWYRNAGQLPQAVDELRTALTFKPNLATAWLDLSRLLGESGDFAGADSARREYYHYAPRDRRFSGVEQALADGRVSQAESLIRAHLNSAPDDPDALRYLADILMRRERHPEAERTLRRCLEIDSSHLVARYELAHVLLFQQKGLEAIEIAQRLFAVDPENLSYRHLEASALILIGQQEQAAKILESAIRDFPDDVTTWLAYGHVLRGIGRQSESIDAYRRSIALLPENGEAYWSLANLKTFRFTTDDRSAMRLQLSTPSLSHNQRVHFEFALAKCLEDDADYAESFLHYRNGNAERRKVDPYDHQGVVVGARRSKRVFTPAFFASRRGWGCSSNEPIFVIGMPRAGSTLIEQILASHPAVEGTMELPHISVIATELGGGVLSIEQSSYPERLIELSADTFRELGARYLQETRVHRRLGRQHFIDKMPNNFSRLGLIHLMFPNAPIIDARRHPLSCCVSGFKQLFARGQSFSYDLVDIGRYYAEYVGLMAHFDQILPGRVHRVYYDQMVTNTEAEVRRLLTYCGLTFHPDCLAFHRNPRVVRTASSEQVRRPIYREAMDDWRHFAPWIDPLREALGTLIDEYPSAMEDSRD